MGRAVMDAMVAIDCRDILPAVRVPTLLLHRRGDKVAHIQAARYMAEHISDARLVEVTGSNHLITLGDLQPLLDQIEDFVVAKPGSPAAVDQLLATLLVANIVPPTGTTAPIRGQPAGQNVLELQRAVVHQALARFQGQEVSTTDQNSLAAFMSPSRAIACADAIRTALTPLKLEIKAGIHTGECNVTKGDFSGLPVQVAVHVAALAEPGEVLVTSTVKDLIAGTHLTFRLHGVTQLPGVPGQCSLYALDNCDLSETSRASIDENPWRGA
jgi:class 3 adenylate cyclase